MSNYELTKVIATRLSKDLRHKIKLGKMSSNISSNEMYFLCVGLSAVIRVINDSLVISINGKGIRKIILLADPKCFKKACSFIGKHL